MIASILNDTIGLTHDLMMGEWANSLLICGAAGKSVSPSAEILSIYAAFNRVAQLPTVVRDHYIRCCLTFMALHSIGVRYCALFSADDVLRTASNYVTREHAFTEADQRETALKECHRTLLGCVSEELLSTVRDRLTNRQEWPTLLTECFECGGRGAIAVDLENGLFYGLAMNVEHTLPGTKETTLSIIERVATGHRNNKCCRH